MASFRAATVEELKSDANRTSTALVKVTTQLLNISSNSDSSAVAELLVATVRCNMMHKHGTAMIADLGDDKAAKQQAQLQLAVAAQSTGASCGLGEHAFMGSLCQHARLTYCLHEMMLPHGSTRQFQKFHH
jgi:hypothetical protein